MRGAASGREDEIKGAVFRVYPWRKQTRERRWSVVALGCWVLRCFDVAKASVSWLRIGRRESIQKLQKQWRKTTTGSRAFFRPGANCKDGQGQPNISAWFQRFWGIRGVCLRVVCRELGMGDGEGSEWVLMRSPAMCWAGGRACNFQVGRAARPTMGRGDNDGLDGSGGYLPVPYALRGNG